MLLLVGTCLVAFVLLLYMLSPLLSPKPLALRGAHVVVSGPGAAPPPPGPPGRPAAPAPAEGPLPRAPGAGRAQALGDRLAAAAPPGAPATPAHPWDGAVFVFSFPDASVHGEAEELSPGPRGREPLRPEGRGAGSWEPACARG